MSESSSVLFAAQPICTVSQELVEHLKKLAIQAPLKRARFCLHLSHSDLVQEMVIVLHKSSYIRPHRHPNKTESFHMIEGSVCIAFFEDSGALCKSLRLHALQDPFLYRLSSPLWHTVLSLTEYAVFHEVTTGPFSPSEYPSWEPKEGAIQAFKERIERST